PAPAPPATAPCPEQPPPAQTQEPEQPNGVLLVRGLHPDRGTWQRQLKHAPALVQWSPERDLLLRPLTYRSLQLGLSGEAVGRCTDEWTVAISDVTPLAREIHELVSRSELEAGAAPLPQEHPYPAGDELPAAQRL
ncbi:DUF4291 family protein, partial [Streptomyces mirabilis]|uniref:DUF4291 family protein n=1 Tax=Streptomyces mirabilis TaxID=68239 RepID=UPI003691DAD5